MLKGYITNLGKYNEGMLIGEWISFPTTDYELDEVFERIGINEEYEEFFFTDWENDFGLRLGEYENIEDMNVLGEFLQSLDTYEEKMLKAILEIESLTVADIVVIDFYNYTFYEGMSLEDVAYEIVEECYFTKDTPNIFTRYFDYEAFARDLGFDGYTETQYGVIVRY